jgi:ADP-ribosylglycohydrolase
MNPNAIQGCVLGTAVGDALGLAYEGLSRRRASRLLGAPDRYRFLFGRGMVSDDTEHTCMVAQSLIAAGDDLDTFRQQLAWRLRWWLASLPAGVGLATARAILKLWIGFSSRNSGVFSAGNGPAMRSAIIGAAVSDPTRLRDFVRASARMTHTDPKAEFGAVAVALAARMASEGTAINAQAFESRLCDLMPDEGAQELFALVAKVTASVTRHESTEQFADSLGLQRGVSGYVYHTVPVVLHAWLTNPTDFAAAVSSVIRCGGDTDTTAAIVGGIVGCSVGREGIPAPWIAGLRDWPRSIEWMSDLSQRLTESRRLGSAPRHVPRLPAWGLVLRNLGFLAVVLSHGFRRLLPPY